MVSSPFLSKTLFGIDKHIVGVCSFIIIHAVISEEGSIYIRPLTVIINWIREMIQAVSDFCYPLPATSIVLVCIKQFLRSFRGPGV